MLIREILDEAGLPYEACSFSNPPATSYAVYSEYATRYGADLRNCITSRNFNIEVYSPDFYDEDAVRAVSDAIDRRAIEYQRHDTAYINDERLYCTVFEFNCIEKDSAVEPLTRR